MTNDMTLLHSSEHQHQALSSQPVTLEDGRNDTVVSGQSQITLKSGDAFLVADVHGDLLASYPEMGLYWHGTRFLRTCQLYLEGRQPIMLSHHIANEGDACQIDSTNATLTINNTPIEQGEIHISRLLTLQPEQLIQTITITSFSPQPLPVTISFKVDTDFSDIFEVRGSVRPEKGTLQPAFIQDSTLHLPYLGRDHIQREVQLHCTPATPHIAEQVIHWQLLLQRGQPVELQLRATMHEEVKKHSIKSVALPATHTLAQPTVRTDDLLFNRLLLRGMHDLQMLSTITPHGFYPYAGIPWFSCPFGRDGLITCLQFLPWYPEVVKGTLQFLAAHQGTKFDDFTDEEPGKMLHEMRTGEMANCREIPYIPYYGSVDVTPLFLITLEGYIRWTNDTDLLERLWPNAEKAACWLRDYGDKDGDGFVEYHRARETGLANQGWKDAWDAISHQNGSLAVSPIALCEVQAYTFAAYRAMGYLGSRLGKQQEATYWEQQAQKLQEHFLQRFWWEEEQTLYLALDKEKEPCAVVASNAGQCLWTGILPKEQAQAVIARLMREDMFSGWGIRTLSTTAVRYNPMSYHNGSIWPHDTALIGAGFARYGAREEAATLLYSLYQASLFFEHMRLPELYCGFSQRPGFGPTRYPVACSPQAWATGAPFLLLTSLLGMTADGEQGRLTLEQPVLPPWLNTLEIKDLYPGARQVHLYLQRKGTTVEVFPGTQNEVEIELQ
uniref:Amylo-alpha-1,6-glucosidase n=1 Tax=Thermosporothrix sp. COM3 TaxID=2490863 RepID=A0A455SSF2_9CHLR|nr:amylo-alpha-1,6-glucosidase [Thermosporothrix sp. COM3]